jgi:hypothetical protein
MSSYSCFGGSFQLTNTLQKKLNEVRREKAELEKLIEHEQLSHSELHSKLTGIRVVDDGNNNDSSANALPPMNETYSTNGLPPTCESPDGEEEEDEDIELEDLDREMEYLYLYSTQ